jgi:hypothetical protein
MKHTPGPWKRADEKLSALIDSTWAISHELTSGKHIIVANVWKTDDAVSSIKNDEAKANAKLIAAAPEMLDALLTIRQAFYDGDLKFTKKRQADNEPYHPANIKLHAAIQKAEL